MIFISVSTSKVGNQSYLIDNELSEQSVTAVDLKLYGHIANETFL